MKAATTGINKSEKYWLLSLTIYRRLTVPQMLGMKSGGDSSSSLADMATLNLTCCFPPFGNAHIS